MGFIKNRRRTSESVEVVLHHPRILWGWRDVQTRGSGLIGMRH